MDFAIFCSREQVQLNPFTLFDAELWELFLGLDCDFLAVNSLNIRNYLIQNDFAAHAVLQHNIFELAFNHNCGVLALDHKEGVVLIYFFLS